MEMAQDHPWVGIALFNASFCFFVFFVVNFRFWGKKNGSHQ